VVAIAPSILAADFARLGEQVQEVERAGVDRIHVDIMDGHFVPNLSMGPAIVKGIRPITKLPLEIHLMVEDPLLFVEPFLAAGADTIIGHVEVLSLPRVFLENVRKAGKRVGLAIKPETDVATLEAFLDDLDVALCMTVHPGFGGQAFLPDSPPRIGKLKHLLDKRNSSCELEVDGGIDDRTGPLTVIAGANVLVAGTSIFGSSIGITNAINELARACGTGESK
jgi:ribulose-phosphate 3-epimerase